MSKKTLKTIRARIKNGWRVFRYTKEHRAVLECEADRGRRAWLRTCEVDRDVVDEMISRGELVSNHTWSSLRGANVYVAPPPCSASSRFSQIIQ